MSDLRYNKIVADIRNHFGDRTTIINLNNNGIKIKLDKEVELLALEDFSHRYSLKSCEIVIGKDFIRFEKINPLTNYCDSENGCNTELKYDIDNITNKKSKMAFITTGRLKKAVNEVEGTCKDGYCDSDIYINKITRVKKELARYGVELLKKTRESKITSEDDALALLNIGKQLIQISEGKNISEPTETNDEPDNIPKLDVEIGDNKTQTIISLLAKSGTLGVSAITKYLLKMSKSGATSSLEAVEIMELTNQLIDLSLNLRYGNPQTNQDIEITPQVKEHIRQIVSKEFDIRLKEEIGSMESVYRETTIQEMRKHIDIYHKA